MKINAICKTPDPDERKQILQSLYDECGTVTGAAKKAKVTPATFCIWCSKYGVETKGKGNFNRKKNKTRGQRPVDWVEIAEYHGYTNIRSLLMYFHRHYNIRQASLALGVHRPTYKNALIKHGIK